MKKVIVGDTTKGKFDMSRVITNYLRYLNEVEDTSYWDVREGIYHISDGSKCTRKVYYQRIIDKDSDDSSLRNFRLGHIFEDFVEKCMKYEFDNIHNGLNIRVDMGDFLLTGETDPVRIEDGRVKQMYEIKTSGNISYVQSSAKRKHVLQVTGYMYGLELDECYIVYIEKKSLDDVVHKVKCKEENVEEFLERIYKLHRAVEEEALPECNELSDFECKFCDYKQECENNHNPLG